MMKISKLSGVARAVVLETLKKQKTLAQLSSREFELLAPKISDWKKQVITGTPSLFGVKKVSISEDQEDELTSPLYQQIGQLKSDRRCGGK